MEDLLNYAVPALVAGFVVLSAGAYLLDKLPEPATDASDVDGLADPPGSPMGPGEESGDAAPAGNATASAGA